MTVPTNTIGCDQTAPRVALLSRSYFICYFIRIFWRYFLTVWPYCLNSRVDRNTTARFTTDVQGMLDLLFLEEEVKELTSGDKKYKILAAAGIFVVLCLSIHFYRVAKRQ